MPAKARRKGTHQKGPAVWEAVRKDLFFRHPGYPEDEAGLVYLKLIRAGQARVFFDYLEAKSTFSSNIERMVSDLDYILGREGRLGIVFKSNSNLSMIYEELEAYGRALDNGSPLSACEFFQRKAPEFLAAASSPSRCHPKCRHQDIAGLNRSKRVKLLLDIGCRLSVKTLERWDKEDGTKPRTSCEQIDQTNKPGRRAGIWK